MEGHHRHRAPRQHTFLGSLFRRDRRTPAASDVPPEVAQPVQTAADESAHDRCTHPDPEDHAAIGQQIADGLMTIIQEAGRLAPDCTGGPLPDWTDKPGTGGVSVAGQVWEHGWPDGGPGHPSAAAGRLWRPVRPRARNGRIRARSVRPPLILLRSPQPPSRQSTCRG